MRKIIDSHLHCWDIQKLTYDWFNSNSSQLNRTYLVEEVIPEMKEVGVSAAILVQATNDLQESEWLLKLAEQYDFIIGAVVWLPLKKPDLVADLIKLFLTNPYFKGVRHQIQDERNDEWLLQSSVLDSLSILAENKITYDIVGINNIHIRTAINVVKEIPDLKIVFDHLNQPPVKRGVEMPEWVDLMSEAAEYKNIYAKVSGLGTIVGMYNSWSKEHIELYVKFIYEKFGPDRIFCGGDWPLSLLAGSYTHTWRQYISLFQEILSIEEQEKVFYKNAEHFYNVYHP